MATYYVGPGGNNANAGTSWALRKLTLNGAEDIPVAAGDTVYVGPGTYREKLTIDVNGSAGSPITYIGDYSGANTDGVGGVVRITGSNNDQTVTRSNAIVGSSKNYRTFRSFALDLCDTHILGTSCQNWTIQQCVTTHNSGVGASYHLNCTGASQANWLVENCAFFGLNNIGFAVYFDHSSGVDNSGHVMQNCIVRGSAQGVYFLRVGGATIRNCTIVQASDLVLVNGLTAGQTVTINNCILHGGGVRSVTVGQLIEDYNAKWLVTLTNVSAGANSNTYPSLYDTRWFFEAVNGGKMLTPFDLASYSQLVNLAGTSPTTTDMRGTAVIGAQREWGSFEFDPSLLIKAAAGGGGAVSISPFRGNIG